MEDYGDSSDQSYVILIDFTLYMFVIGKLTLFNLYLFFEKLFFFIFCKKACVFTTNQYYVIYVLSGFMTTKGTSTLLRILKKSMNCWRSPWKMYQTT